MSNFKYIEHEILPYRYLSWKVNTRLVPLTGYWVYNTWWKRFRGFIKTGKWPKKRYVRGLYDTVFNGSLYWVA